MKNLILLGLTVILFTACNQEVRYTQQSPEIDTYKKAMDDYKNMNWESMPKHYADTAKIASNVIEEKALTVSQAIEKYKQHFVDKVFYYYFKPPLQETIYFKPPLQETIGVFL